MNPVTELTRNESPRILVIGDLIVDVYIHGNTNRISPEAPIPILLKDASCSFLGGAANVALNLAALGCGVSFISLASSDQQQLLVEKWRIHGRDVFPTLLQPFPECKAPVKTRFYADGQCMLRVDEEATPQALLPHGKTVAAAIHEYTEQLLDEASYDAIVISDYEKGTVSAESIAALASIAEGRQIPLFVDTKKSTLGCLGPASTLKPNLLELNRILRGVGRSELSLADIRNHDKDPSPCLDSLRAVSEATGAGTLILTASGLGALVYCRNTNTLEVHKTANQDARDVSGAGDTFFAGYIANWCEYRQPAISCQAANYYAGCAVRVTGTYLPKPIDIYRYLRLNGKAPGVVYLEDLKEYLTEFLPDSQRGEYNLGFTNGCFDILHPGHMSYLREAKACCDLLVCGLNSDVSVQALKGPTRPVHPEAYRAQALLALGSIDLVVIFADPTPENAIQTLKPDLLIKGGDYSIANIVGAEFVASYGGQVLTMPLIDGFSTTKIIRQVMEKPLTATN
jgi:D-beta-D-heptose 7-phosphate kinase/D-beta-D-heptose 1-phosphate adenosyltransferase